MSRIGQKPILVPDKVKITVQGPLVNIEGPRGKLKHTLPTGIEAALEGKELLVKRTHETRARCSRISSREPAKASKRSSRSRASVSRPRWRARC
jgi:ribosomal protein L6P/L9E